MTIVNEQASTAKPQIHLIETEYDIIADLALGIGRQSPELSKLLLDEIDRAELHSAKDMPKDVVTIGSEVVVLAEHKGAERKLRLVLPGEADVDAGRVSILTSIGAGLIGLRVGQSISWPYPNGEMRMLKILQVTRPSR